MSFSNDVRMVGRFVGGMRSFLETPLSPEQCRARIAAQLRSRERSFLQLLERGVFGNPRSPYRALLARAKLERADVARLVEARGVEGALAALHECEVHVSIDEFKGRKPIERLGHRSPVDPADFDNPLSTAHYEGSTGGSRGPGTRLVFDLDLLAHEAATMQVFDEAFGVATRPIALWRPIPPGSAGMRNVLRFAKLGRRPERWFSQNDPRLRRDNLKHAQFTKVALATSRLWRRPLPTPEHVPLGRPDPVVDWLSDQAVAGRPALLDTSTSCAVRLASLAVEQRKDIGGTLFRVGGEPFTRSRAERIERAGCRAAPYYAASESGQLALGCGVPAAVDDLHVLTNKMAVLRRAKAITGGDGSCNDGPIDATPGASVDALYWTTLLPSTSKLMINVEIGDMGTLVERDCGCPLGTLGLDQHLHTIRSYEKLTTEGMHFLGSELLVLVESVLPARFGGAPTDYQFVEEEDAGLRRVSLVVSPRVGRVDDDAVVATVLETLGSYPGGNRMMASYWKEGRTVRLVRREPYATLAAKIQPLHVVHGAEAGGA